ncbi:MAG TPA: hypothetical protein VFP24_01790, partial [Gaiellaceae bacterium]|nr:hypothetical protein [Gaiellaceae bacterium]
MKTLIVVVAAAALLLAAPAGAAVVEDAAQALRSDPVYVHPEARLLSDMDAAALRRQIGTEANGPLFIALLPESAKDETGGSATEVALRLGRMVRIPGVYAVVVGNQFRAVSTDLGSGRAAALATEAFEAHRNEGVYPVLSDFISRVGEARQRPPGAATGGSREGSRFWLIGLVVGGAVVAGVLFARRKRRARELAEVKSIAREDLVALADDVSGLEADVERSPEAKEAYSRALNEYDRA